MAYPAAELPTTKSTRLLSLPSRTNFPKLNWHSLWWPIIGPIYSFVAVCSRGQTKPTSERAALRIADTCLQLTGTTVEERAAAAVLLDMMANRRTIALAAQRSLIPLEIEGSYLFRSEPISFAERWRIPLLTIVAHHSR